jgi:hypothetical protein
MKYLFFICMLFSACGIFKKSAIKSREEITTSTKVLNDSVGRTKVDSISTGTFIHRGSTTIDSDYDKVTEEVIVEVIDSNLISRQVTRTIKEKGQKKVEKSSSTIKKDSSAKKVDQIAAVMQDQEKDSNATKLVTNKIVNRSSFIPWWLWVIMLAVVVLTWLKRYSIIKLFI